MYDTKSIVGLRKFPYPYKAALAIASDIDSTNTVEEFIEIQEFLNTKNITNMGEGVGLEIGNSFFMFHPTDKFSYFSTKDRDKIIIRKFIEAGYFDCLHSWGDGYKDRNDAKIALNELKKYNLNIKVWINHSDARSNIGRGPSSNLGDNRDTKYYHADLTIPYGIKYVWMHSLTSIIGQATPITFTTFFGSFDSSYSLQSIRHIVKSLVKNILSIFRLWQSKYSLHANNDLIKIVKLKDGQKVYEFLRYDSHPDGIGYGATSKAMAYNLSEKVFRQLKKVRGYGILYTHFGKNKDCPQKICEETQRALRNLEKEYRKGEIYVTTTSKLLNYYINHKYLKYSYIENSNEVSIEIHNVEDPVFGKFVPSLEELQGITFYVPKGKSVRIFIDGKEIKNIIMNQADEINQESVTIPFKFCNYPSLNLNHVLNDRMK